MLCAIAKNEKAPPGYKAGVRVLVVSACPERTRLDGGLLSCRKLKPGFVPEAGIESYDGILSAHFLGSKRRF